MEYRYLVVFNDGETTIIGGYDLENALFFTNFEGHSEKDIISVVKIDN